MKISTETLKKIDDVISKMTNECIMIGDFTAPTLNFDEIKKMSCIDVENIFKIYETLYIQCDYIEDVLDYLIMKMNKIECDPVDNYDKIYDELGLTNLDTEDNIDQMLNVIQRRNRISEKREIVYHCLKNLIEHFDPSN